MKKKRVLKKKYRDFLTLYMIFSILFLSRYALSKFTFSKFVSSQNKSTSITMAKPIINIENNSNLTNIVSNSSIEEYFSVSNYNETRTTDIGLDFYIYFVDENGDLINNVNLYVQSEDNNPNEFTEITKITSGEFSGYYNAGDFTTTRTTKNFKITVAHVIGYSEINVKVKAIQKRVI